MSAAAHVLQGSCENEEAGVCGVGVLGETGAGVWGFGGVAVDHRAGAGGAWGESDGADFYRGSVGGFFVRGAASGGIGQPSDERAGGGRVEIERMLHQRDGAVCAAGK